jgi:ABC-type polysaccharide/polyol phosphate export permease
MIIAARLYDGWWNWLNTLNALMLREVRCRFAGDPIGYAWAFIVPLLWIGTLMAFFTLLGRAPAIQVDTPAFIATGVVPYVLFRYTVTSMARVVSTHRHLTHFGHVRIADMLVTGALLELLNAVIVFASVWLIIALVFNPFPIHDPLGAINGILLTSLVAGSFGRLATILGLISETAKRVIPVLLRPMFWISGVFFTATELPPALLKYLWWNPLLHTVEMIRGGVFLDYRSGFADIRVPLFASAGFLIASYIVQDAAGRARDGRELL